MKTKAVTKDFMMRIALTKLFVLIALSPLSALAEGELEAGLALFDELEYEAAIPHFERALGDERLSEEDRSRAALHLGIIHIAFGDEEKARARFDDALGLNPEITLPVAMSPHVEALFEAARDELETLPADAPVFEEHEEDASLLRLAPLPPSSARGRLEVTLDPERQVEVERIVVRHRRRGEGIWFDSAALTSSPNVFEAELPAPGVDGTPIEYYIEAFGRDGSRVGQLGSAAVPLSYGPPVVEAVSAPEDIEERGPFYTQWWFYTATGAAVTAGIVTGVIIAGQSRSAACLAPAGHGCVTVGFE